MIKVSEYASWSIRYYKRIIDGCLDAVGAPRDLVQFVVGYGATGSALVTSGVDKVTIFSHFVLSEIFFNFTLFNHYYTNSSIFVYR